MEVLTVRLKQLMTERKLTQYKLAQQCRIPYSTITSWFKDKINITLPNFIKIAQFFDVSLDYLAGLSDER